MAWRLPLNLKAMAILTWAWALLLHVHPNTKPITGVGRSQPPTAERPHSRSSPPQQHHQDSLLLPPFLRPRLTAFFHPHLSSATTFPPLFPLPVTVYYYEIWFKIYSVVECWLTVYSFFHFCFPFCTPISFTVGPDHMCLLRLISLRGMKANRSTRIVQFDWFDLVWFNSGLYNLLEKVKMGNFTIIYVLPSQLMFFCWRQRLLFVFLTIWSVPYFHQQKASFFVPCPLTLSPELWEFLYLLYLIDCPLPLFKILYFMCICVYFT